jgi:hypothetical protein
VTAGHIHTPRLVMLDRAVKSLLRRHAFVKVDCDGHVADTERRAGVCLFFRDAGRYLNRGRILRPAVREMKSKAGR